MRTEKEKYFFKPLHFVTVSVVRSFRTLRGEQQAKEALPAVLAGKAANEAEPEAPLLSPAHSTG